MTRLSCDAVRDAAPELVLGTLDGVERARVLAHVEECARCREEITALTDTVAGIALVAPDLEPSAGFTDRVLAAGRVDQGGASTASASSGTGEVVPLASPAIRRRRWPVMLAAAAAVVALAVGLVARTGGDTVGSVAVAVMVAPKGGVMGTVSAVGDGSVAVVVEYPTNWRDYQLQAVHLDGTTTTLGLLSLSDGAWRWEGPIPDATTVDRVRVVRPDGQVTCWGRLPA